MLSPYLTVIIPVYNERTTIAAIVQAVLKQAEVAEVLVVNDGSSDGTREELEKVAIRTGILYAKAPVVIIQDADLEYDPTEYPLLLRPILEDKADVVFGSRFIGSQEHRVLYFWHSLGNRFLTLLSNIVTNLNLTDMETCYKVVRRELLQSLCLKENRFGLEPELTVKLAKKKVRIYEVAISYHGRTYAEGKKVNWKDGFRAIYCLLKYSLFSH